MQADIWLKNHQKHHFDLKRLCPEKVMAVKWKGVLNSTEQLWVAFGLKSVIFNRYWVSSQTKVMLLLFTPEPNISSSQGDPPLHIKKHHHAAKVMMGKHCQTPPYFVDKDGNSEDPTNKQSNLYNLSDKYLRKDLQRIQRPWEI